MPCQDVGRGEVDGHGLFVVQEYANALHAPSLKIQELGSEFSRSVVATDPGVRILIDRCKKDSLSLASKMEAERFLRTIAEFASSTAEMASGVRGFQSQIERGESISRVLRKPLNRLRAGTSALPDADTVVSEWGRLTGVGEE